MTVVEYVVAKGKTEVCRCRVLVDGNSVVPTVQSGQEPDVVFTLTPALAESIASGALSVGVGYMRGAVKMAGDFGALLAVLPALHHQSGLLLTE